jgi:hypothetical protein
VAFGAEVDVVLEHLRTTANRESLARSKRPKMEGRRQPREKDERKPSAAVLCGGNNDGLMYHLAQAQQRCCGVRR